MTTRRNKRARHKRHKARTAYRAYIRWLDGKWPCDPTLLRIHVRRSKRLDGKQKLLSKTLSRFYIAPIIGWLNQRSPLASLLRQRPEDK